MNQTIFWQASVEDLKKGYLFDSQQDSYICLVCGEQFKQGVIYPMGEALYDAQKAMCVHIESSHPPIFEFYLALGKINTGLSSGQTELAKLFYEGHADKEIAKMTDANSVSTIRNQRFSIRGKYKQAKILVALVELLEERIENLRHERKIVSDDTKLVDFHLAATSVDERYAITQQEKDEVISRYFADDNTMIIKEFPAKEKKKIVILQKIMADFEANMEYSEIEVNEILKRYYDDFATIRRYLIQYGFLDRSKDVLKYWVKLM